MSQPSSSSTIRVVLGDPLVNVDDSSLVGTTDGVWLLEAELSTSTSALSDLDIVVDGYSKSGLRLVGALVGVPLARDRLPFLAGDLPSGEFRVWSCLNPLTASSPTVAWRRSSMKVHRPSLRSPTSCFPVLTRSSFVPFECCRTLEPCGVMVAFDCENVAERVGSFLLSSSEHMLRELSRPVVARAFPNDGGESRDNVLVCLPPSNTFLCGCFVRTYIAFRLSSSILTRPCAPASTITSRVGEVSGRSCSTCRISFLFFVASCTAHWRLSLSRSTSAFCSSSFNSSTRRS